MPKTISLDITVPDEGQMGPALKALSPRMRAFVVAMVETGGKNASRCARIAGYGENQNEASLKTTASRLAHDERVQAAMREEGSKRLGAGLISAASTLVEIAESDSPLVSTKDKLRAVEMLMNRAGMPSTTEQKVTVTHQLSDADIKKRITVLAKELGMDPQKLLGSPPIDGEFVDITPSTEPTGLEGLEDVLG